MKVRFFIAVILFSIFFLGGNFGIAYSDETHLDVLKSKSVEGELADIDWMNATITVKLSQTNGRNDEMIFDVTEGTTIMENNVVVELTQLISGNGVVVEYDDNSQNFGPVVANKITVLSADVN